MDILNKDLCLNVLSDSSEPLVCLASLINIYKDAGIKIENGAGPNTPLIYATINNKILMMEAGVTVQELIFFHTLLRKICPKNIYGVGNAFGWSTLAFALICPISKIVVIDNLENLNAIGISIGMVTTLDIVEKNNLNVVRIIKKD